MLPLSDAKGREMRTTQKVVFRKNSRVQDLAVTFTFTAVTSPTLLSPEGARTNE